MALSHSDWYRGGAMREDIATVNFAEYLTRELRRTPCMRGSQNSYSSHLVNKGMKKGRSP